LPRRTGVGWKAQVEHGREASFGELTDRRQGAELAHAAEQLSVESFRDIVEPKPQVQQHA
jgi:hypothetical protein